MHTNNNESYFKQNFENLELREEINILEHQGPADSPPRQNNMRLSDLDVANMHSPPFNIQSEQKNVLSTIDHDTSHPRIAGPLAGRNDDSHMEVEMMDRSMGNGDSRQMNMMNVDSIDSNSHFYIKKN